MKQYTGDMELAVIGKRFVALFIDGIIQGILVALLYLALGSDGVGSVFQFFLTLLYGWYFLARNNGQTPGKQIMKIRVIKEDGTPLGDGDAIVRVLASMVSGAVFLIGFIWALFDQKNQTWHDKAVGTLVVNADSR